MHSYSSSRRPSSARRAKSRPAPAMPAPKPDRRAAALRDKLDHAANLYYDQGTSPLSDAEYDELFRELQALEIRSSPSRLRMQPRLMRADLA